MNRRPGAATVVRLLLATSWRRSVGWREHGRTIMQHLTSGRSSGWGGFGVLMLTLTMTGANGLAAALVRDAVVAGQRVEAAARGEPIVAGGLVSPTAYTGYPALLATLALGLWLVMLVLQGEGPELDVQRRRLSHVGVAAEPPRRRDAGLRGRDAGAD